MSKCVFDYCPAEALWTVGDDRVCSAHVANMCDAMYANNGTVDFRIRRLTDADREKPLTPYERGFDDGWSAVNAATKG
jgi:hypothetical protein